MDLLSNLTYAPFNDFFIEVSRIQYGWMDLCIGNNGQRFRYSASYVGDPLNELLAAAVSIVNGESATKVYTGVTYAGDYFYITHDLEPHLVTWVFMYKNNELTLIVWNDMPNQFDELIENAFNVESFDCQENNEKVDIVKNIAFKMKGSALPFIKALCNAIKSLALLKRDDDSIENWGFSYSIEKFDTLNEYLLKNNLLIN